jgi:archaellum component FlaC
MFKLFKGKSEIEKLQKKYESLMSDWHKLSTTNRAESDKKYAEAQKILEQIENLQKSE